MQNLLVMATIAGRRCAFHAHDVQSVIELNNVTPVPGTAPHIAGITALRSQALTVIDCRLALGFDPAHWADDHRAIVVSLDGYSYALKVDGIEDITTGIAEPEAAPGGFGKQWDTAATGMIETGVGPALLLKLDRLIEPKHTFVEAA